jgi:hypothetical protein
MNFMIVTWNLDYGNYMYVGPQVWYYHVMVEQENE